MKEKKSINLISLIFIGIIIIAVIIGVVAAYGKKQVLDNEPTNTQKETNMIENDLVKNEVTDEVVQEEPENPIESDISESNEVSEFDLSFLKQENKKENKVYSPLSIRYALKMLEEATEGESKKQISNFIGSQTLTKYNSNKNMAFANAFFIRNSFEPAVKESYVVTLKDKYNAEIKFDSFENATNINNWINENTFEIIPEIVSDETVSDLDFALINALAIDMEWNEKFITDKGPYALEYLHEKRENLSYMEDWEIFSKKDINVQSVESLSSSEFKNGTENLEVSGMWVYASINNYDAVNELGEENIKKIVSDEYRKFARGEEYDEEHAYGDFPLSEDTTDEGIQDALDQYFTTYIPELDSNYHKSAASSEFSIYEDKEVKVFAKGLKEYNDTTLQYVGIMPKNTDLDKFISKIDNVSINKYISELKSISYENFKEGVLTRIYGFIPKFNFEYDLDLMKKLKENGITDIFDIEQADLSNLTTSNAAISSALHKANIEFTQDGIKAAAATFIGGYGAGEPFNYEFDVPVEEIDITFNKPYMFLIRDKESGDVWFAGTVYEPLLWENEDEHEKELAY